MKARGPFGWPRGQLFKIASQAEVDAGTDDSGAVTPLKLARWAARGVVPPEGRLTLTSGVSVLTGDVAGATSLIYTPSIAGALCPVWDGSKFVNVPFTEVSQLTTDNAKSPAAVANNSNYDAFGWMDGSTFRVTRGPAWTSDTARGTGAGTTELDFTQGIPRNKVAITNGPGIGLGTFLGTIRSNGSAQIDMKFGSAAAGGGEARLCVWNCFNRVTMAACVQDNAANWSYNSLTIRSSDNSATNRISAVMGLNEDAVYAQFTDYIAANGASNSGVISIGLNSTSAHASKCVAAQTVFLGGSAPGGSITATFDGLIGLGFNFLQALERSDGTGGCTFVGVSGSAQSHALTALLRM